MNIKINKSAFNELLQLKIGEAIVGSRLYGTDSKNSDTDISIFYDMPENWQALGYPNIHQFQFDDLEKNTQYLFTTEEQFWKNQRSGDSTINSDIILFGNYFDFSTEEKLAICRTYKICKAYLGFAKRDIKMLNGKNKYFHALRSLYTAECLMNYNLPNLAEIKNFKQEAVGKTKQNKADLLLKEKILRNQLNQLFEDKKIEKYYIEKQVNPIFQMLLEANNIREFRY